MLADGHEVWISRWDIPESTRVSSVLSLLPLLRDVSAGRWMAEATYALLALLSPSFPPCPVASCSNSLMSSPNPMMTVVWFEVCRLSIDVPGCPQPRPTYW